MGRTRDDARVQSRVIILLKIRVSHSSYIFQIALLTALAAIITTDLAVAATMIYHLCLGRSKLLK